MNKRIEELYLRAFPPSLSDSSLVVSSANEFAEMIIDECAEIAGKEQDFNDRSEIQVNIDQCILIEFGL